MAVPGGSEAARLAAGPPARRFTGILWRWHHRSRDPLSSRGSELTSGRYHRARAQAGTGPIWPALYLGLDTGSVLAEAIRYLGPDGPKSTLGRRLTRIEVALSRIVDLRDLARYGWPLDDLIQDRDWSIPHDPTLTQRIGLAALGLGIEGLIVPAASRVGANMVILVSNLSPDSSLSVLDAIDPKLYVPRS